MLFDKRYKVYLDVGEGYFQCFPDSAIGLTLAPEKGQLFTRFGFDGITFKNHPGLYEATSNNAYKVYDLIHGAGLTQQINLKITMPSNMIDPGTTGEIVGYQGQVDCKFNHHQKEVIVKPSIIDKYTDVLENWETEINVFGEESLKKARFDLTSNGDLKIYQYPETGHCMPIVETSSEFTETQTPVSITLPPWAFIKNCIYAYTVKLSLYINARVNPGNGTIKIYLNIYDGSNDDELESNLIDTYADQGTVSQTYSLSTVFPKGSYARIYVDMGEMSVLVYNSVSFSIQATSQLFDTTNVSINIKTDYSKTRDVWNTTLIGRAEPKDKDMIPLTEYFNINGSPKDTVLSGNSKSPVSVGVAPSDILYVYPNNQQISIEGKYLPDITETLDSNNSDYELSEVTIYKGNDFFKKTFGSRLRKVFCTCKYTRFEAWMPDDVTPPVPDAGWTAHPLILKDNQVLWTKLPYDGTTGWNLGELDTTPGTIAGLEYHEKITSKRAYPNGGNSTTKPSRSLYEITKTIYNGTHENLVNKDVKSCFFWNDANPDITVSTGVNYFTNEANFLNNIACVHTYQFQTSNPDSEDSVLKISLKNWLADLMEFFEYQVYFYVDSNGDLWIEHIKHIDLSKTTKDLTQESGANSNYKLLKEINSYDYDTSEMFATVHSEMVNSGYKDFTGNKITYPPIATNKRNKDLSVTRKTKIISTDIRYCVENPSDLENGIVLINHDGNYNSISANVPITGQEWENGNLALSNILNKFMYEGVFTQGWLNGAERGFEVAKRSKKGVEITLKGIYGYDFFKTAIGVGMIEQVKQNLDEETTTATLRYRYGSDNQTDVFELMVSMEGDYEGATNVSYDFGEA